MGTQIFEPSNILLSIDVVSYICVLIWRVRLTRLQIKNILLILRCCSIHRQDQTPICRNLVSHPVIENKNKLIGRDTFFNGISLYPIKLESSALCGRGHNSIFNTTPQRKYAFF